MSRSQLVPRRQPFIYLAAALAAGIVVNRVFNLPPTLSILLTAIFVIIAISMAVKKSELTVWLLICSATAGMALSSAEIGRKGASNIRQIYESGEFGNQDQVEITGVLVHPPEPAPIAYYLDLAIESVQKARDSHIATGNVKLTISTPDLRVKEEIDGLGLQYGYRIRVVARMSPPRSYHNPGSPDFDEFLEREGYDLAGVIKSPPFIENLGRAKRNLLLEPLYKLRAGLMSSIDSRFEPRLAGVLKAVLAGNRNFIDDETAQRLKQGGTFHTLVVAGLHVGIIAWLMLGWRRLRGNSLWVALSIVVLWAYAIMVGLAPPVVRATTMISVGLIGPLLFRRAASLNTVAMAAFIMLVWSPGLIADPGFQLSFAAVAGIVALGIPFIDKLREIGSWRPSSRAPHPPRATRWIVWLAETMFWDQRQFDRDMTVAPVRYRLHKSRTAVCLNLRRVQSLLRAVVLLIVVSTAIQISTAPLMILYFNRVSPIGILLNVTAGLFTAALMVFGCAAIIAGSFSEWLASHFALLCAAAKFMLVNSVTPFLSYSWSTWRAPQYEGWQRIAYAIYYVPLISLSTLLDGWRPLGQRHKPSKKSSMRDSAAERQALNPGGRRTQFFFASALTFVLMWIVVIRPVEGITRGKLTVYFLDVGQGDSALIVFPQGRTMLVDGGGEITFPHSPAAAERSATDGLEHRSEGLETHQISRIGETVVSRFLWSLGLRKIDYVLATHSHQDHVGGLFAVLQNFKVGELLIGDSPESGSDYLRLAATAKDRKVPVGKLDAGRRFVLDGIEVDVLWPDGGQARQHINGNNDSLVLRLSYGRESILLAGDIEQSAESAMVRAGAILKADLLKVPHHGSRTSSSNPFLDAVNPAIAIVSVGEPSRFGHPHQEVLSRYSSRGVTLYRTGQSGAVTAETDGNTLTIKTFQP